MASRSATACSSAVPDAWSCDSAADVSSTAVLRVNVANCSRCASCTDSACCSANSRNPRSRSSGSPPKLKPPKPPSMFASVASSCIQLLLLLAEALDHVAEAALRSRRHAPDVDRAEQADHPYAHEWRAGADRLTAPAPA